MKNFGKMLPYLFLYIVSAGLVGLLNAVTVESDTSIFREAQFWNTVISQNLANFLTLFATILLYNSKHREEDVEYLSLMDSVRKAVRTSLDSSFGSWVFSTNRKEKKLTYKAKVRRKLNKLEHKAKPSDLLIWYGDDEDLKKSNKLCQTMKSIEASIGDEQLEKTIGAVNIKYDEIDRSFVETGEEKLIANKNGKQAGMGRIMRENSARFMIAIACAMFFNAYAYTPNKLDATFWFKITYSLGLLISMFVNGRAYSSSYLKRVLMVDLNTRFNIIKDFLTFKVNGKKEV